MRLKNRLSILNRNYLENIIYKKRTLSSINIMHFSLSGHHKFRLEKHFNGCHLFFTWQDFVKYE